MGYGGVNQRTETEYPQIGTCITYPYHRLPEVSFVLNLKSLYSDLKNLSKGEKKNILILEDQYVHIYYTYILMARSIGYRIAVISHEWLPVVKRKHWIQNVSASLYGKYFGKGVHAILPISHYIQEKIRHFNKPELMTPILAEFPELHPASIKENKIVYCVFAYYHRVINMVIDAYDEYTRNNQNPMDLTLVLSGPDEQIEIIKKRIEQRIGHGMIEIKTKLPYNELLKTYQSAKALLIPLDPDNEQDKARFSQKIAEYLSAGGTIISNNVGEIPYYFSNLNNIILCEYSLRGLCEAFDWIHENPSKSIEIGINGFNVGKENFDCCTFCKKLHKFLSNI